MTVEKRVDYNQGRDRRWDIQNVTRDGACLGLAVQWIINTSKRRTLLDWLAPSERSSPQAAKGQRNPGVGDDVNAVLRVMRQQATNYDASHEEGLSSKPTIARWARNRVVGTIHGVDALPTTPILFRKNSSWGRLAQDMSGHDGYYLGGFWLPDFGHAISSYISRAGDYVLFFEPNWGEFTMKPKELHTWLPKQAVRKYGRHDISTHFVVHCPAQGS